MPTAIQHISMDIFSHLVGYCSLYFHVQSLFRLTNNHMQTHTHLRSTIVTKKPSTNYIDIGTLHPLYARSGREYIRRTCDTCVWAMYWCSRFIKKGLIFLIWIKQMKKTSHHFLTMPLCLLYEHTHTRCLSWCCVVFGHICKWATFLGTHSHQMELYIFNVYFLFASTLHIVRLIPFSLLSSLSSFLPRKRFIDYYIFSSAQQPSIYPNPVCHELCPMPLSKCVSIKYIGLAVIYLNFASFI